MKKQHYKLIIIVIVTGIAVLLLTSEIFAAGMGRGRRRGPRGPAASTPWPRGERGARPPPRWRGGSRRLGT